MSVEFPEGTRLRIGVDVGVTVQVAPGPGESFGDWLKPRVHAQLDFDGVPNSEVLGESWEWMWNNQVGPQSEELLDLMQRNISKRMMSIYKEADEAPSTPPSSASPDDIVQYE